MGMTTGPAVTAATALDGYGLGGLEWQPNTAQKKWLETNMPQILQAHNIAGDYNDPEVRGQYYRQVALPEHENHNKWTGFIQGIPLALAVAAAPYAIAAIGAGAGATAAGTTAAEAVAAPTIAGAAAAPVAAGTAAGGVAAGAGGGAMLAPVITTGLAPAAGMSLGEAALATGAAGAGAAAVNSATAASPGAAEPAPPTNAPIPGTEAPAAATPKPGLLTQASNFIKSPVGQAAVNIGGQVLQGYGAGKAAEAEQEQINQRARYYDNQWRDPAQLQALKAAVAETPSATSGYLQRAQRVSDFLSSKPMTPGDPNKVYGSYVRGE